MTASVGRINAGSQKTFLRPVAPIALLDQAYPSIKDVGESLCGLPSQSAMEN